MTTRGNVLEDGVFLKKDAYLCAAILKLHNNCMRVARLDGKEVEICFLRIDEKSEITMIDYLSDGWPWEIISEENFEKYRFYRYMPLSKDEAVEAAAKDREVYFFDLVRMKAYKRVLELDRFGSLKFVCRSRRGAKETVFAENYGKKYIFLDPKTDRMSAD